MAKKRKMARGAQKGGNPPKHTQFRKGTSRQSKGPTERLQKLSHLPHGSGSRPSLRDGRWEDSNDFEATSDHYATRYQSRWRRSSGDG